MKFLIFKIKFCAMKLTPTESWDNGLFEITAILCILSICLMWERMKSWEFESHHSWKEIFNKVFSSKKTLQLTKVCVYSLCLTLSLGPKLLSSYWHFPKKIDIEFVLRTLRNVCNIKVPFFISCTQFTVFSCAIDAAQLVWCILYFNLKTFPGWVFFAQKL